MGLLLFGLVFHWWGFTELRFDARRGTMFSDAYQFTPWVTTHWYTIVAPQALLTEWDPVLWWDFPAAFPQHSQYGSVSAALWAVWTIGFALIAFALWARRIPRRRLMGFPTLVEAGAAGCVAAAVLLAYSSFPAAGQFPSFLGGSDRGPLLWGPGLGWFAALIAVSLLIAATWIGVRLDRKLVGVCWFCLRAVSGPRCGYCKSRQ